LLPFPAHGRLGGAQRASDLAHRESGRAVAGDPQQRALHDNGFHVAVRRHEFGGNQDRLELPGPGGTIDLVATTEVGKRQDVAYRRAGDGLVFRPFRGPRNVPGPLRTRRTVPFSRLKPRKPGQSP